MTFYLLRCATCDAESGLRMALPFASAEARGRWASEHTAATGHASWIVTDEHAPEPPHTPSASSANQSGVTNT